MDIDKLKNLMKKSKFRNPTNGLLSLKEVVKELTKYRNNNLNSEYKVFIGTDSEERENRIDFVSVIAIHRIGNGGRYFWLRNYEKHKVDRRSRILKEATMSLALAYALLEQELENNHIPIATGKSIVEAIKEIEHQSFGNINKDITLRDGLEIHVDIGNNGPTRAMIKEITGMIRGSGFNIKIKPEACAAANVADRYL